MANVVLVVDVLRGFCEEGYPLYVGETIREIIPNIRRLLAEEKAGGSHIIFLCDSHDPDDKEFQWLGHCRPRVRGGCPRSVHTVKLFVSGGVTPARIRQFLEAAAPVDSFGVGSYISGARPIDFTADIKEVEGRPVAKRGRIPGVIANPRLYRMI
jgi:nicotinamidase-related amidase